MRRRRAVLASVGTFAVSGCLSSLDGGDSPGAGGSNPGNTTTTSPPPTITLTAHHDAIGTTWPLPARGPGRSNYAPNVSGPVEPVSETWATDVGARVFGPVLADGTLYAGAEDGVVRAVDAATGDRRWEQSIGASAWIPSVLGGTTFVPTDAGLTALEAATGDERWSIDAPDRRGLLAAGHGLYYVSEGDPAHLVRRARASGAEHWRAPLEGPWWAGLMAVDETVIVPTGTNGDFPWVFEAATGAYLGERRPEAGNDMEAEQLALDGTIYAADSMFGEFEADFVEADGTLDRVWRNRLEAYGGVHLAGGADRLFFGAQGGTPGLYALDRADGGTAWHVEASPDRAHRPVAAAEAVLFPTESTLYCLDPADGRELWRRSAEGIGRQLVPGDGRLYTAAGSTLRALGPEGG